MREAKIKKESLARVLTICFAIIVPIAMILTALILTLIDGDWWFNLFAVYLGAIAMIFFTLYLSLGALFWESIRNVCQKNVFDTPFIKALHRILFGTAVAGIISFVPFVLIFFDVLNGMFALPHFVCGGVLLLVYLILGTYSLIFRIKR